jgi:hypothetical protein
MLGGTIDILDGHSVQPARGVTDNPGTQGLGCAAHTGNRLLGFPA